MPSSSAAFPTSDPSWALDTIFEGGADSRGFDDFLDDLADRIERLEDRLEELPSLRTASPGDDALLDEWAAFLDARQHTSARLQEAFSFATAQAAAHTDDDTASRLPQRVDEFTAQMERVEETIVQRFRGVGEGLLEALAEREPLRGLELHLREYRNRAERAMSENEEQLAAELGRDGVHAWGNLRGLVSGRLTVEIEDPESGEDRELSVGRARSLLSSSDREVRRRAHRGMQQTWASREAEFAAMLSNIYGTRQTLMERRGTDPLTEPLEQCRIERESLEAMMEAVEEVQPVLHEYLEAKAEHLGREQLDWYDKYAPLEGGDESLSWEKAQEFVVEQIGSFSDEMAEFYRDALASQWVEAEDREGKSQGGFCTMFPVSEEVRVFLTYGGNRSEVMTLAHELGHAYHFWRLQEQPPAARDVPMTLAESASTLSEKIVETAALEAAEDESRLRLLDNRLSRSVMFMLEVPARFRLEQRLHEARRRGPFSSGQLKAMSQTALEAAFGERLASVDEYHWAATDHFYMSRNPFYNFPYTVGYLFSKAVYERARRESGDSLSWIDGLLLESGRRTMEALAEEYLGADLGAVEFWRDAAASIREDVDRYRSLVEARA